MRARQLVRAVSLGLVGGVFLSFFLAFGRAQEENGFPLDFATAAQTLSVVGDFSLVLVSPPAGEVYLPYEIPSSAALDLLRRVSTSLGINVCVTRGGVVLAGPAVVCIDRELPSKPGVRDVQPVDDNSPGSADGAPVESGTGQEVAEQLPPARYAVRVYIVEVNEERAAELGVDWRQFFDTANLLSGAFAAMFAGYQGSPQLDQVVAVLEQEGLGRRLDDLTLFALEGESVSFNRGGSINVALVGGETVERATYQVGLTATLTVVADVEPGTVRLVYQISDTSPSNVSDPQNIQLSSTSNASSVSLGCGQSTPLVALNSERISGTGEGLPAASRVPGLGYAFGQGSDSYRQSSIVVSAVVECL